MIATLLFATAATVGTMRLTETSITEVGRIEGVGFRMKTKGYGLGYIHPSGFGGHFTSLTSVGEDADGEDLTRADLRHVTVDASYTYGVLDDHLLATGGFGLGVAGKARYATAARGELQSSGFASKTLFLGPGFSIGFFEAYWIHRRNFLEYKRPDGGDLTMRSHHYQLGLGARF